MPPDAADGITEADYRYQPDARLTVVCAQTQILQRRVKRLDGRVERDRERFEVGLTAIFSSANAIGAILAHMPLSGGPGQAIWLP